MGKSTATKADALIRLAEKGAVRARDLQRAKIPRAYLKRLSDRGVIEAVDRGVYRLQDADATEMHTLSLVAARVPHSVICLLSALEVHELTTEMPHATWILIDRKARMPKVANLKLEVVWASGAALDHGIETRVVEGVKVRITSPAKTVADCFRYRRHVGLGIAIEAMRDYLRYRKGTVDALGAAAKADRIYPLMRPYLEAML